MLPFKTSKTDLLGATSFDKRDSLLILKNKKDFANQCRKSFFFANRLLFGCCRSCNYIHNAEQSGIPISAHSTGRNGSDSSGKILRLTKRRQSRHNKNGGDLGARPQRCRRFTSSTNFFYLLLLFSFLLLNGLVFRSSQTHCLDSLDPKPQSQYSSFISNFCKMFCFLK